MRLKLLPDSGRALLSLMWTSLKKIDPLSPKLILLLAILLFLTDMGYEGQRSPDRLPELALFSVASILIFFAIYFGMVFLTKSVQNRTVKGIALFSIVIIAEICKSAVLIFVFRTEVFVEHFLERLPGDISLAALYWLIAGVIRSTSDDHLLAVSELNRSFQRLYQQRSLTLKTASEVEQDLHEKASSVLLSDLDRLASLSREIMDAAKASEVKLEILRLIRNQVRPLSQELRVRVEVLESLSPSEAPSTKLRSLRSIPRQDASYVVSYLIAMPNIFSTFISKTDLITSLLLLLASVSYPLLGRLVQNFLPKRKFSIASSLIVCGIVSAICYLPFGFVISFFASQWQELLITVFTAGAVLLLTCLVSTSWFTLQRQRLEILEQIKQINREAKHEFDLLDQSIWVAQRRWSFLIHGTVQAALTVAASRLELSRRPDDQLRVQVESDITRAKDILTNPPEFSGDARVLLDEIVATWEGVCSFSYQISSSAEKSLNQSPTSTICFIEILKELVSNASRHGGATKFWLNAYLNPEGDLEMIAGNNGKPVPSDISAGLGFQMITDLTRDWEIDRKAAGFSATLPMPRTATSF